MGIRSLRTASISTGVKRSKVWDQSAVVALPTSYESIATQTVGAGGAASVTFSSVPSGYKHLQIRGISRCTKVDTGSENVVMSFNGDTTNTNYRTHLIDGDGAGVSSTDIQVSAFYAQGALTIGNNATANAYGATVIDILDYTNTNKNKTVRLLTGVDTSGYGQIRFASSLWMNTAAITSITLNPRSAGNFSQYSTFALYGIKG
jgi:hypothetical protein